MTIFMYEMKQYLKSVLVWGISIASLILIFMMLFPTFSKDSAMLDMMIKNYPEELLKAFGMSGGLSLSSLLGYLGMTFVYVQICLAMQSANYGFSCLSVEERELTADFLMSKPVSRRRILLNKFLAAFLSLVLTNLIVVGATYAGIYLFGGDKPYDQSKLHLLMATGLIFQLFFLSIGMVLSVLLRKIRSVLSFSLGMSFGMYIAYALRAVFGGEFLGFFTPFYYFDANAILETGQLNGPLTIFSCALIVASLITTYVLYLRRNIHSV